MIPARLCQRVRPLMALAAAGCLLATGCVEQRREERGWRATGGIGDIRPGTSFGAKPLPRGQWVEPGSQWEVDASPDLGRAGVLPEGIRPGGTSAGD